MTSAAAIAQIHTACSSCSKDEETATFIVAGDFNMSDASLIYDEIAGRLGDGWRGAGNGAGRTWPVAEAIGLPPVIQPYCASTISGIAARCGRRRPKLARRSARIICR